MTDMNKIADKIQKLLALAGNNPSEQEAQAAMLKAQKLMAEYNIDMSQAEGADHVEYSCEVSSVKTDPRDRQLANIVANSFACKLLITYNSKGYPRLAFFGRKDNAEAAKLSLEFIHKAMERGMSTECKKHGLTTSDRGASAVYNMYAAGFIYGLKEAMDAQTVALAVVVPEDVKEAFANKYPNLGKYRGRASQLDPSQMSAYASGKEDGRKAAGKRLISG